MGTECKYLTIECIDDELQWGRIDAFDAFLNDMISILIFYTWEMKKKVFMLGNKS